MPRAAFYIDGFNLYHAIAEYEKEYLKWSNYWRLAELVCAKDDQLVKVVLCTAYYPDFKKKIRHELCVNANMNAGVDVILGHYIGEDMDCKDCGREWVKPTEKQGDINVALALFHDAHADVYDHAYLVSADSDQAATARRFAAHFPAKRLYSVSPPGRQHSKHILQHTPHKATLTEDHLDLAVFPKVVPGNNGRKAYARPFEYDPPEGWVHPDQRPK